MLTAASTTRPLDTGRLSPTTLEDLNSAASLLTRVDRKYLVASSAAQNVVDALTGRALVLDIDVRRSFSYASTYFDTPDSTPTSRPPGSADTVSRSAPAPTSIRG